MTHHAETLLVCAGPCYWQLCEEALKPVLGLIRLHDRVIWDLETVSETGEAHIFGTTDDHPWWVEGHGWKRTDELSSKDILVTQTGEKVSILSVTNTNVIEPTFNFEVADFNTYFVGESKVWVHNAACDVSTLIPGPNAKKSIPASSTGRAKTAEQRQINDIGNDTGCHTCGSTDSGRKSGNFTGDHQPPTKLNENNDPQRLFPHCDTCSRRQAGEVTQEVRRRR